MTFALIYHDVAPLENRDAVGFPGPVAGRYKLDPRQFEAHLDAIAATGVPVAAWDPHADGARTVAALTFDDGGASATDAAAALERRGWIGHFFITTGRIGTNGFLDADAIRGLRDRGHVIGAHSHSHPTYMGRLEASAIADEWERSRSILTELLGAPPAGASVPGGFVTPEVIAAAKKAGFDWLMTSTPVARVSREEGIPVLGRYTIWATTPAQTAAAYARGARLPRLRLQLEWSVKQRVKRISPRAFESARAVRARF